MRKFIFNILFIIILFSPSHLLFAARMTCPPGDQVKHVKLIRAKQHPYDPTYWNFISNSFTHHEILWNVAFGSFFPEVKTEKEALEKGQAYFDQASLVRSHPIVVKIREHILLCDYMPEGRLYYISALNPPEKRLG